MLCPIQRFFFQHFVPLRFFTVGFFISTFVGESLGIPDLPLSDAGGVDVGYLEPSPHDAMS
jgi:hypothetical protein